jgi:translocation and assembly module TamB
LIPELPVAIDLHSLSVERLALAAPILGQPASLSLQASAELAEFGDDLSASLAVRQLSGNTGTATLDLSYRQTEDFLRLAGKVDEPRGGIFGRLLGLPQGSNLQAALDGEGPLKDWHGRMNADLNNKKLVELTGDVRGAETRTIAFTLRAAPDDLLPEKVRPLIAGGIDASGSFAIRPGGSAVEISAFSARAMAGEVNASGLVGLKEPGDFSLAIALGDSRPFAPLVPNVAWSGATLKARVQGVVDRPHVTGDIAVQSLAAADRRLGAVQLALDASAEQGFEQPIGIRADLHMSDLTLDDPRLTALVAEGVRLNVTGSLDRTGTVVADKLEMHAANLALSGSARAEQWGATARTAKVNLSIADIAALAAPFGLPGKGSAEIALTLAQADGGERLEMTGTTQALSIGQPIADRLLGQSPRLHVALAGKLPQEVTITTAEVTGDKMRFDAHGSVMQRDLDLSFTSAVDDAAAIDPMLGGKFTLDGTVGGTMEAPLLAAELNSPALIVAERRLEQLKLNTTIADVTSAPKIDLDGTAIMDRLPAKVTTKIAVEGERIAVPSLALALGKSRVTGDVVIAGGLLTGKADINAPDLAEVGQLAGTPLGGALTAKLQLTASKGRQGATVSATGQSVSAADAVTARSFDLKATAEDLLGKPVVAADLALAQPTIADRPFDQVSLTAKGPLSALQTRVALAGADLNAEAEAEVAQIADGYRVGLQNLAAKVKDVAVKTQRPATIEVGAKATRIDGLDLAIADGSLRLNGSVAPGDLQLKAEVQSLPLAIVRAFKPGFPITGRLNGEAEVTGSPAAPSGRFTITGDDIGASNVKEQQADLQFAGTLRQGALDVTGELKPRTGGALTVTAALPSLAPDARLQANAKGTLDLALVDTFLAGGADRVRGKAELDLSATGQLSAPELRGTLRLVDSRYENLRYGIKLRHIEADIRADGPAIQIASLSATTPGGGRITGEGTVNLGRAGIETDIRIKAQNATVIDTDLATATVDSDLAISGNVQSRMKLGGKITVVKADIRVPDRLPPTVQEIEVVEVNASPRVAARNAAREPPPRQTAAIDLDLAIDAPQRVAVRGRGLDVELGGALKIGGTSVKPDINGALKLRRGSLDIVGKRLEFTEGQLTFDSGDTIDPILDLTAVTRAQDLQITAKVEGSARAPRITLSSVPDMPDDEILARLLFSKSAGALSPLELLQLAQATASLAGVSSGPGLLEKLRAGTGLDRLSVDQGEDKTGPSVSAGRYVSEGVYVGVSQGAQTGSSAATVEIEVTPNVKVETELGVNSDNKAGVNLEWDY